MLAISVLFCGAHTYIHTCICHTPTLISKSNHLLNTVLKLGRDLYSNDELAVLKIMTETFTNFLEC